MAKTEGAGRPTNDDESARESQAGMPPESAEGVDHSTGEGRKALSRDDLYARLSAVDDPEEDEAAEDAPQVEDQGAADDEPAGDDEAEEPGDDGDDAADPADAGDDDADPSPEDKPKAEEKADKALLGRVPDEEWSKLPKVTKERINALKADRKRYVERAAELEKREPIAKYGEAILTWADRERVSDADMEALLEIGAKLQRGGQQAIDEALRIARHYGWKESGPAAPSTPERLPDWLQARVDNLEMTEEAAAEVAAKIASSAKAPEGSSSTNAAPALTREQEELRIGREALASRQAAAAAKYKGQWAKLWPEVQREMLKHRGAPGSAWASIFDAALEVVRIRHEAVAGRKRAVKDGLEAASASRAKPDPDKLTGRARLLAKYVNARPK